MRWLFGWRYISSLHSADEPQEGRNSCPLLRSCFIGSCHVGVSKRFSRSISPAVCTVIRKFKLETISSSKIPRIARAQHACRLSTQKMEIYNNRGPKQTWHQNDAPTREQMRLFASNIKELQKNLQAIANQIISSEIAFLYSLLYSKAPPAQPWSMEMSCLPWGTWGRVKRLVMPIYGLCEIWEKAWGCFSNAALQKG